MHNFKPPPFDTVLRQFPHFASATCAPTPEKGVSIRAAPWIAIRKPPWIRGFDPGSFRRHQSMRRSRRLLLIKHLLARLWLPLFLATPLYALSAPVRRHCLPACHRVVKDAIAGSAPSCSRCPLFMILQLTPDRITTLSKSLKFCGNAQSTELQWAVSVTLLNSHHRCDKSGSVHDISKT